MRKLKLITIIFILLTSCSKDDSEFIVGQWKVTARFESQTQVELNECDEFVIYEFSEDFSMWSFIINDSEIPDGIICGIFPPNIYEWEKVDEDMYITKHKISPNLTISYKVENGKLLVDYSNNNSAIYSRN